MAVTPALWLDRASAIAGWANAPGGEQLDELLAVARESCLEWAPIPPDEALELEQLLTDGVAGVTADSIPVRYRLAQRMQARALWEASKAGPSSDAIGGEGYSVTVRPLGWAIKNVLRPQSASRGLVG